VTPAQNVSFGFNSRLFRIETVDGRGRPRTVEVTLTPDILSRGLVPLAWDIDGAAAARTGSVPHFSAPSLNSRGPYAGNRLWWPGLRHGGQGQFALIDGSVHSTSSPLSRPGWQWGYQPHP
jgi:prepilin-type processing-associated H-X9-DG protein